MFEDNLRAYAIRLEQVRFDKMKPKAVRSRAIDQAARARRFDSLVQRAFRKDKPLRVVLLSGEDKEVAELGYQSSRVDKRLLDPEPWYVHSYDDKTGLIRILRGLPRVASAATRSPKLVDQFSAPTPTKTTNTSSGYSRSAEVRATALKRAAGLCELCKSPGFETADGSLFLETHHVISLSENGPDIEWNVVAICPNDHREAHLGARRLAIQEQLINVLAKHYPGAAPTLEKILSEALEPIPA